MGQIMQNPCSAPTGQTALPFQQSRRSLTAWHGASLFLSPQRRSHPFFDRSSSPGNHSISSRQWSRSSSGYGKTSREPCSTSLPASVGGLPVTSKLPLCSHASAQSSRPHSSSCTISAGSPPMRRTTQALSLHRARVSSHRGTYPVACCSTPNFHKGETALLPSSGASSDRPRAACHGVHGISLAAANGKKQRPALAATPASSEGGKEGFQGIGDFMKALGQMMSQGQQQPQQPKEPAAAALYVKELSYQPPGGSSLQPSNRTPCIAGHYQTTVQLTNSCLLHDVVAAYILTVCVDFGTCYGIICALF